MKHTPPLLALLAAALLTGCASSRVQVVKSGTHDHFVSCRIVDAPLDQIVERFSQEDLLDCTILMPPATNYPDVTCHAQLSDIHAKDALSEIVELYGLILYDTSSPGILRIGPTPKPPLAAGPLRLAPPSRGHSSSSCFCCYRY